MISVTNQPGAMALTRTPLKASSRPSAFVICTTPALAVAYAIVPFDTPKPSTEAMLTIAPGLPAASMRRAASVAQANTAIEIGGDDAAPFGFGHFDRAVGVGDAGIVA